MVFVVEIRAQCDQCQYVMTEPEITKAKALESAISNGWKKQKNKLICDGCLAGIDYERTYETHSFLE